MFTGLDHVKYRKCSGEQTTHSLLLWNLTVCGAGNADQVQCVTGGCRVGYREYTGSPPNSDFGEAWKRDKVHRRPEGQAEVGQVLGWQLRSDKKGDG